MPLKKECCRKCLSKVNRKWIEYEYIQWRQGYIYCPIQYVEPGETTYRNIKDEPPIKCPFMLEHILSNED